MILVEGGTRLVYVEDPTEETGHEQPEYQPGIVASQVLIEVLLDAKKNLLVRF